MIPPVIKSVIQKYLNNHSQAIDLSGFPQNKVYDYVLIVPVCGEAADFLKQLMQTQKHRDVLVVLLINHPEGHIKSQQWQAENVTLMQQLSSHFITMTKLHGKHRLFQANRDLNSNYEVLLLDFNEVPFDANKGVGLARRVAADTALSLIELQKVRNTWIFSTDADVVLPQNYFESINSVPVEASAISLNFEHKSDNSELQDVQHQYDFKLRYYQSGVKYIGAKYDYIPLGSTLIIDAESYAKVRGFPSRSGGEDFYILNKLAKIDLIYQPEKPVIEIQSRFSERVPFGTGPAISQIQRQQANGEAITYYHPEIFIILRVWRKSLLAYYQAQQLPANDRGLNAHWQIDSVLNLALKQIKSNQRWQQFIHEWFDAFKILKSVHYLRTELKSMPYKSLLEHQAYSSLSPSTK